MESTLQNHDYTKKSWVKFTTCTFMDTNLNWWNTNVKTIGVDVANTIQWEVIKRMMVT